MRVLVGCERSGVVRGAFLRRGHDAYSCDVEESLNGGPHIQEDFKKGLVLIGLLPMGPDHRPPALHLPMQLGC